MVRFASLRHIEVGFLEVERRSVPMHKLGAVRNLLRIRQPPVGLVRVLGEDQLPLAPECQQPFRKRPVQVPARRLRLFPTWRYAIIGRDRGCWR